MEVVFRRTGERQYYVEARCGDGSIARMDPAPGYDAYFPHDLQHLIVEEHLGLANGIYGRLANGGTASTFSPVGSSGRQDKRAASRARRKLQKRNAQIAAHEPSDFGRSERATLIAWHDWLSHCREPALQFKAAGLAPDIAPLLDRMDTAERNTLIAALPTMRTRIDEVARQWHALAIGGELSITWRQPH